MLFSLAVIRLIPNLFGLYHALMLGQDKAARCRGYTQGVRAIEAVFQDTARYAEAVFQDTARYDQVV